MRSRSLERWESLIALVYAVLVLAPVGPGTQLTINDMTLDPLG